MAAVFFMASAVLGPLDGRPPLISDVRQIFGVNLYRLNHPHENRILPSLDVPIGTTSNRHN